MKTIKIQISNDSITSSAIGELDRQLPESTKNSPEFKISYYQVIGCIEDFSTRARKLAKSGTTIHIQKEFALPDVNILIALDYPKKTGFLEKLACIFRGN
jgi:hypothetical protein